MLDYQTLYQLLEVVEGSLPTVGLVDETEDRLAERIELHQVHHVFVNKFIEHLDYLSHIGLRWIM